MNWYKKIEQTNPIVAKINDYEATWRELKNEFTLKGIERDPTPDEVQQRMLQQLFPGEKELITT